jgi:uncharacterized membrane protein
MKTAILSAAIWLHSLALVLWIGGIIIIGAVVAPVAFSSLEKSAAGNIVGASLRRFNQICYFCSAVLILTEIIQLLVLKNSDLRDIKLWLFIARGVMVISMILLLLFLDKSLFNKMDQLQAQGQMDAFNKAHKQYESLTNVQLSLGAIALLLSSFLRL